jgi:PTS system mannose-specific IIA component
MEERRKDILAAVDKVEAGDGVIILTDMFGGTPSNLAISLMGREGLEVIAGVNLPMLIKLQSLRGAASLDEAARLSHDAARNYINIASKILSGYD